MPDHLSRARMNREYRTQVVSIVPCPVCVESVMLKRGRYYDEPDKEHAHQPGASVVYKGPQMLMGIGGATDWKKREQAKKKRWDDLAT